jgi:hypothetical protein
MEMDVPDELCEIGLTLAEYRLMPSMKNMINTLVPAIVILAIPGQHPLHNVPDGLSLPLDQQVNVVRHQTVSVEEKGRAVLLFCQQREEFQKVIVTVKDVLPVIAARYYMIETALNLGSQLSSHGRAL